MSLAFLFHYLMLNMFWMLIHPSSGACNLFVELFHGLYCSVRTEVFALAYCVCVSSQLVDSPFTVGRGVVVSGRFNQFGYGIAAFICYHDVCVSEYVCDLMYLQGNVCECCPGNIIKKHNQKTYSITIAAANICRKPLSKPPHMSRLNTRH